MHQSRCCPRGGGRATHRNSDTRQNEMSEFLSPGNHSLSESCGWPVGQESSDSDIFFSLVRMPRGWGRHRVSEFPPLGTDQMSESCGLPALPPPGQHLDWCISIHQSTCQNDPKAI